MSYPQGAPGGPGFPPAQQPTNQFSAPTQQFSKLPDSEPAAEGPSRLPLYLSAATAALGLLVFLSSFGPQFAVGSADLAAAAVLGGISLWGLLVVVAALLAAHPDLTHVLLVSGACLPLRPVAKSRNLAMKPAVRGTPAKDSRKTVMAPAAQGLRRPRPLKASRSPSSPPTEPSRWERTRVMMPKAPTVAIP